MNWRKIATGYGARRPTVPGWPLNCLASDGDWVLSGINHGGNLGVDVYESGTVAAAREAAIHGCKAVALSHYTVKGRSVGLAAGCRKAAAGFG